MADYKDLIESLRSYSTEVISYKIDGAFAYAVTAAADAIEQLIRERDAAWNTASLLCEGFLDMPSGCDGCPLFDTMIFDEEGNGICSLSRRDNDETY